MYIAGVPAPIVHKKSTTPPTSIMAPPQTKPIGPGSAMFSGLRVRDFYEVRLPTRKSFGNSVKRCTPSSNSPPIHWRLL